MTVATRDLPTALFAAARARLALVSTLIVLATVGWAWTAHEMRGMDNGPWTSLGGFGWFLGVWIVMMAAMMLPSVAPTVALYSRMSHRSSLAPYVFALDTSPRGPPLGLLRTSSAPASRAAPARGFVGTMPAAGSPG